MHSLVFPYVRGNIEVCSFMPNWVNLILLLKYKNVVTQFLVGNFYCQIGIYNAEAQLFCENIVSIGQLEAEIKWLIRLSSRLFGTRILI